MKMGRKTVGSLIAAGGLITMGWGEYTSWAEGLRGIDLMKQRDAVREHMDHTSNPGIFQSLIDKDGRLGTEEQTSHLKGEIGLGALFGGMLPAALGVMIAVRKPSGRGR